MSRSRFVPCLFLFLALLTFPSPSQAEDRLVVFAAASTTDALNDIGPLYTAKTKAEVVFSFGSSSTLAKQIENGAPTGLFVSANLEWMDYVAQKNRIAPESRVNLLGNALVLVAPKDQAKAVQIEPGFDLAGLLESGRLAVGDPDHVPAGQYAKTALEKLGVWAQVEPKLARAKDVRAALAFVERGECPYGIVYQTDAALAKNVQIVGEFPQNTHPAIVYPAAVVAGPQAEAGQRFLDFLKTPASKAVFEKYGFKVQ